MKLAIAATALALTASMAAYAAPITYSVTETAGNQTAKGTITTDGITGVLAMSDITAFSFLLSNGTTSNTVSNTNGGTFALAGNDLTATTSSLLFNFADSLPGSGFAMYDTNAFNVLCIATFNTCSPQFGSNIVIALNGNYTEVNTTPTSQVIGTVPAAVTPEPSSLVLLGTGALGAFATLRRRVFSR